MSWRSGIHGYAAKWGVMTLPVGNPHTGARLKPAIFHRGCFAYDASEVEVRFMHHGHQRFGKGAEIDLKIWEDSYGLAFSFRPPAHAYSLVCGIAQSRYRECSVGAELLDSIAGDHFDVRNAALYEISIAPRGACPGTMCWHSGVPFHELRPDVRPLALAWEQGRGGR